MDLYLSDYIRALKIALKQNNPNDSSTEVWNDRAIDQLASYYYNHEYQLDDLGSVDKLYNQYDLLKWLDEATK